MDVYDYDNCTGSFRNSFHTLTSISTFVGAFERYLRVYTGIGYLRLLASGEMFLSYQWHGDAKKKAKKKKAVFDVDCTFFLQTPVNRLLDYFHVIFFILVFFFFFLGVIFRELISYN